MPVSARKAPPGEDRSTLKRGVAVFAVSLALGFAGLYLVAGDEIFRIETYRVRDPGVLIVVLCVLAFIAGWFVMDSARIWLLCRTQRIPVPFRSAVLVHLSAMFVAALTPGNVGVAPATAVALRRLGVPFGRGVGIAIRVFVLDLIFFAWAVPLSLGYLVYSGTLRLAPGAWAAVFAAVVLAIFSADFLIRYPRPVVRLILAIARWPLLERFASRLRKTARDYYRSARDFKSMATSTWLALNLLTATGWFSGFVLFWLLLRLYGIDAEMPATLAILTGVTLVSHLVLTPGGSGFMEVALGLSIGASGGNVVAALLIWRLASYHAIFLLGPPAGWLLYLSKPAAAKGLGTG
jgi:uncharacterized protein (TIRG00374 family)